MGVKTVGLLNEGFDFEKLAFAMEGVLNATVTKIDDGSQSINQKLGWDAYKYGWIDFIYNGKNQSINVSESNKVSEFFDKCIYLSMTRSEVAIEIMEKIVKEFGGYLIKDDCAADNEFKLVVQHSTLNWEDYYKNKALSDLEEEKRIIHSKMQEHVKEIVKLKRNLSSIQRAKDQIEFPEKGEI